MVALVALVGMASEVVGTVEDGTAASRVECEGACLVVVGTEERWVEMAAEKVARWEEGEHMEGLKEARDRFRTERHSRYSLCPEGIHHYTPHSKQELSCRRTCLCTRNLA